MAEIDMERVRAAQRAYAKEWRAKNKDKVREKNLRYWAKRAERESLRKPASEELKGPGDQSV